MNTGTEFIYGVSSIGVGGTRSIFDLLPNPTPYTTFPFNGFVFSVSYFRSRIFGNLYVFYIFWSRIFGIPFYDLIFWKSICFYIFWSHIFGLVFWKSILFLFSVSCFGNLYVFKIISHIIV